jgi:hypothetical protein
MLLAYSGAFLHFSSGSSVAQSLTGDFEAEGGE